jgi:hypothetical protein
MFRLLIMLPLRAADVAFVQERAAEGAQEQAG